MFNPFVWLDSILLGAAQKFCDGNQKLFGITKFALEKWALVLTMLFFSSACLFEGGIVSIFLIVVLVAAVTFRTLDLEKQERDFFKNNSPGKPPYSMYERLFWLIYFGYFAARHFSAIGDIANQYMFYADICIILATYFNACVPRPPSKSKMCELYEKGLWWIYDWSKPAVVSANS